MGIPSLLYTGTVYIYGHCSPRSTCHAWRRFHCTTPPARWWSTPCVWGGGGEFTVTISSQISEEPCWSYFAHFTCVESSYARIFLCKKNSLRHSNWQKNWYRRFSKKLVSFVMWRRLFILSIWLFARMRSIEFYCLAVNLSSSPPSLLTAQS